MKPVRIIHAVGGMDRAGIETWLMHMLRRIDRSRFQFDFLVHSERACAYDDEIRALGSRIIPCPHPHRPWRYAPMVRQALREHGPYDAIHSHLHRFSGLVLRLARMAGITRRIAHSHIADIDRGAGLLRRLYLGYAGSLLRREATMGLAASEDAAADLFGSGWRSDPRWQVLPCGLDLSPFAATYPRDTVRAELGIAPQDVVLGHVGRFETQKNHRFLVEVGAAARRINPRARLLLIGDGGLRADIENRGRELRLDLICTGSRPDVPRLLAAMDVFVFPSLFEGLGLVLIEAQAAGLPVITSTGIPKEATVAAEAVRRLPLEAGAEAWAKAALDAPRPDRERCLAQVESSPFNLAANMDRLLALYEQVPA